jgi:hypothetical protein
MRLDPFSTIRVQQLCCPGIARFGQRRFGEAASLLRKSARLNPFGAAFALLASS